MKAAGGSVSTLKREYARLRQQLARIGYISQGSVQERTVAASGRSGYQWTRKVGAKTVSVALSPEQFLAMQRAVTNVRAVGKTLRRMEQISRQIIFQTSADTRRRRPLSKKTLGLN